MWLSQRLERLIFTAYNPIHNNQTMNYSYIRKAVASVSAIAVLATSVASFGLSTATAATSFTDASGISSWAAASVQSLVDAGVLAGRDNGSFDPQGQLNRAEIAKVATLAADLNVDTTGAPHFADVAPSDWYYQFVETLYNNGVVGGINGGALDANGLATYNPGGTVNRAEGAKILVDAFALETAYAGNVPNFADVASSAWYFDSVETAYAHGLMNGYDDGRFGPGDAITREQVAVVAQSSVEEAADGSKRRADYTAGAASDVEDDTPVVVVPTTSDGTLSISVAASSPASATLPGTVSGVTVASFDFTASSDDVVVTSVEIHRGGLGLDTAVTNIALFDNNGRVSKAKTFNSSTDVATVNFLGGGLTVAAGTTNTVRVVATLGTAAANNGSQFNMEILSVDAIAANAQSVTGSFPAAGAGMEIGASEGQQLTIATDGSVSNPKLGERGIEIAKFKLTNDDSDNEVLINSITLKETGTVDEETEVENYTLYIEGEMVATAAGASNKYITFNIDGAYSVKTSKTVKAVVKADIVGGAGKSVILGLDNVLDLEAEGTKYGYGASIAGTYTAPTATVQAGQLTIISTDAPMTDVLKNKDNVVLGSFSMIPGTDAALEFQQFKVTITNTGATTNAGTDCTASAYDEDLLCQIENVELYDVTTGSVYDLGIDNTTAYDDSAVYSDTSLTIAIDSTHEFQIRADTLNRIITGAKYDVSIAGIGTASTGGIVVQETADDTNVDDITPASLTYKTVNGVAATATISTLTQSATSAVIGSAAINALEFEVEAGNASDLYLDEIKVKGIIVDNVGVAGTAVADNTRINQLALYKGTTLLDTVSGSALDSTGVATFDGFREMIAANGVLRLRVEMDIIDDVNQATDTININLTSLSLEDYDADDVTTGLVNNVSRTLTNLLATTPSSRTVTIAGAGSLTLTADNTDTATNTAKNVLGGATSDFVASFEATATNEGVQINDLTITSGKLGSVTVTVPAPHATGENADLNIDGVAITIADAATAAEIAAQIAATTFTNVTATSSGANVTFTSKILTGTASNVAVTATDLVYNTASSTIPGITLAGGADSLATAVSEIVLYANDKTTEIGRKSVTSGTVTFTDINHVIAEGSENIYVKVVALGMGKDKAGTVVTGLTLAANAADNTGASSNKVVTATGASTISNAFSTVATRISNVAFVSTASVNGQTVNVDSTLTNGENVVAIIAVTTDASSNTNTTTGASIKTKLTRLGFSIVTDIDGAGDLMAANSTTIERIGGTGDKTFATVHAAASAAASMSTVVTLGSADAVNSEIENSSIAYFAVKATPSAISTSTGNKSIQIKFTDLDNGTPGAGDVNYDTDQLAYTDVASLNLGSATLDAPKVASNY